MKWLTLNNIFTGYWRLTSSEGGRMSVWRDNCCLEPGTLTPRIDCVGVGVDVPRHLRLHLHFQTPKYT